MNCRQAFAYKRRCATVLLSAGRRQPPRRPSRNAIRGRSTMFSRSTTPNRPASDAALGTKAADADATRHGQDPAAEIRNASHECQYRSQPRPHQDDHKRPCPPCSSRDHPTSRTDGLCSLPEFHACRHLGSIVDSPLAAAKGHRAAGISDAASKPRLMAERQKHGFQH